MSQGWRNEVATSLLGRTHAIEDITRTATPYPLAGPGRERGTCFTDSGSVRPSGFAYFHKRNRVPQYMQRKENVKSTLRTVVAR